LIKLMPLLYQFLVLRGGLEPGRTRAGLAPFLRRPFL
jgi:hypothetical protein